MKRVAMAALVASTAMVSVGCGSAASTSRTSQQRALSGVRAVEAQTSGELTIRPGDTESLTITAPASVIDDMTSDVVDGVLVLGTMPNRRVDGNFSYVLTVPALEGIWLEGSGNVTGSGVLTGDAQVTSSGSGSITLSRPDALEPVGQDLGLWRCDAQRCQRRIGRRAERVGRLRRIRSENAAHHREQQWFGPDPGERRRLPRRAR